MAKTDSKGNMIIKNYGNNLNICMDNQRKQVKCIFISVELMYNEFIQFENSKLHLLLSYQWSINTERVTEFNSQLYSLLLVNN